jgi:TfoX/Sxy family transcriptional regulator of competence genes
MKKWKPSPETLKKLFLETMGSVKGAEKRKMFGYDCAFVNGNMFTGLHEENWVMRLPENRRTEFVKTFKTKIFEPFPGRTMKEYVVVPENVKKDQKELKKWLQLSYEYVKSLPPKKR